MDNKAHYRFLKVDFGHYHNPINWFWRGIVSLYLLKDRILWGWLFAVQQ